MTVTEGRFDDDGVEDILDALMADAKEYFGEDLNDDDLAIVRTFYRPIAERMEIIQNDIGIVLDSSQIDYAEGQALDYLTALIGIVRDPAVAADGEVTFSRDTSASVDYVIPKGTVVQTDSEDPEEFKTTEQVTLLSGNTSVTAPVTALEEGADGNTGSNTITVMPDPPTGIESVTNAAATTGGSDVESDDELRKRAKDELASGNRASAVALYNAVKNLPETTSVSIYIETSTTSTGLPGEGFEIVAAGGNDVDIAQTIFETKAAGDTSYGGTHGTQATADAEVGNGQTYTIQFSRPTETQIYVDADLEVTDEFAGIDAVQDSIVNYIGGILTTGQDVEGIGVGDDVIYGTVEYAIRDVEGVYDIVDDGDSNTVGLAIGTSSGPTSTSNIAIAASEVATSDGTDGSLNINKTQV